MLLYRGGAIGSTTATIAILAATAVSIVVKVGLTATSPNRQFASHVAVRSTAVLVLGVVAVGAVAVV